MAILVDEGTKVVVAGITGSEGTFHSLRNRTYGTDVVAGVTPGKGGQDVEGIPVFDTVADAVERTGANTSLIFVPARFAPEAIYEAADAGIGLVVCITETWCRSSPTCGAPTLRSSGRTVPASSHPAARTSGSSPARSASPAGSGSSAGAAP
jgi:succinyl-CoA synthetase alpha subunit